jgi:hypothetical protein
VDALYQMSATRSFAGGDFAAAQPKGTPEVMMHASQFKCVAVKSAADYDQRGLTAAMNPEVVSNGAAGLSRTNGTVPEPLPWTPNACALVAEKAVPGAVLPSLPELACSVLPVAGIEPDHAYWMVVGYENATNKKRDDYIRGCINECAEVIPDPGPCSRCTTDDAGRGAVSILPAGQSCAGGVCDGNGRCGACVPGARQCKDATVQQICTNDRVWDDNVACTYGCNAGACYPDCAPASRRCATGVPQQCDAAGRWQAEASCAAGNECVGAGVCMKSNGQACTTAAECASGACTRSYRDGDGDGYGAATADFCGASSPAGYVLMSGDCCDTEANAKPGQASFFTGARTGCGGFDYNCDGSEDRQLTSAGYCYAADGMWFYESGWLNGVPSCGASAAYTESCRESTRTQGCR